MPKWEYLAVSAGMQNRDLEQMLNARGVEGWELVVRKGESKKG